jgi:hypothetical protein
MPESNRKRRRFFLYRAGHQPCMSTVIRRVDREQGEMKQACGLWRGVLDPATQELVGFQIIARDVSGAPECAVYRLGSEAGSVSR